MYAVEDYGAMLAPTNTEAPTTTWSPMGLSNYL